MKKLLSVILSTIMVCSMVTSSFAAYRVPESWSYNGLQPDGTPDVTVEDVEAQRVAEVEAEAKAVPYALIGYKYVPGYETLDSKQIVTKYKYIYGTSISYVAGTSPSYKLTVS